MTAPPCLPVAPVIKSFLGGHLQMICAMLIITESDVND